MMDGSFPDDRSMENVCKAFKQKNNIPGLASAVYKNGKLLQYSFLGNTRETTVFRIASMTKVFTCCSIMILRDQGLLSLDDSVGKYIPQLSDEKVSLRMLMSMRSGFATDNPHGDRLLDMSAKDFDEFLVKEAGRRSVVSGVYEYCNLNFALLGRVLSNVSKVPFQSFIEENVLKPLDMTNTSFQSDKCVEHFHKLGDALVKGDPNLGNGAYDAMGGLFSTVQDLGSKFCPFMSDAWSEEEENRTYEKILSRSSRREIQTVSADYAPPIMRKNNEGDLLELRLGYGFGVHVFHHVAYGHAVGHSGGVPGFGSHFRWTRSNISVVSLGNCTYAPCSDLCGLIMDAMLWKPIPVVVTDDLKRCFEDLVDLCNDWNEEKEKIFALNVLLDAPRNYRKEDLKKYGKHFILQSISAKTKTSGTAIVCNEHGKEFSLFLTMAPTKTRLIQEYKFK